MEVYQSKYFLAFFVIFAGCITIVCCFGFLIFLRDQNWTMSILGFMSALGTGLACFRWLQSLVNPKPLVVFSRMGIINRDGVFLAWSDVTKAYRWTGVLFVKDKSRSDWFIRIEPLEVGREQFTRAVQFVLDFAPTAATEKLKNHDR